MIGAFAESVLPGNVDTTDTELALVAAARNGDLDAFGTLFEQHKDPVYRFVLRSVSSREDAEDIVQESFCRAWASIDRFRGEARFSTWVYRIAAGVCADRARLAKRRGRLVVEVPLEAEEIAVGMAAREGRQTSVTRQAIARAMAELPLAHRQLVVLCDVQGFTSGEAAEILGCSAVSVRVRLCRAHAKLRQALSRDGEVT